MISCGPHDVLVGKGGQIPKSFLVKAKLEPTLYVYGSHWLTPTFLPHPAAPSEGENVYC